jgi:hypothetical protein
MDRGNVLRVGAALLKAGVEFEDDLEDDLEEPPVDLNLPLVDLEGLPRPLPLPFEEREDLDDLEDLEDFDDVVWLNEDVEEDVVMEEAVSFNLWKVWLILFALRPPGLHLPDVHSLMVVMPHPIKLRASSTSSWQCRIMACTCWIGVIRFGGGGRR